MIRLIALVAGVVVAGAAVAVLVGPGLIASVAGGPRIW